MLLADFSWNSLLSPPVLAIGGSMIVGMVAIGGGIWAAHKKSQMQMELKQDMIERGMSAEEIERVLKAGN
jgi:hypothetical protein